MGLLDRSLAGALRQAEGHHVRRANLGFAYHALIAAQDAAEEYMFLSGGRHVHDAGIELFISGEIARRLVARRARVTVPWAPSDPAAPIGERAFSIDHAWLEAGRGSIFGGEDDERRLDIALVTTQAGPGREPLEAVIGVEVKRHLTEVKRDIEKLGEVLLLHRQEDWCLTAGASISFSSAWRQDAKPPERLLGDRLSQYEAEFPHLRFEACWLERDNPLRMGAEIDGPDGGPLGGSDTYRSLAAYCVFVTLR
jgi:hypothetical protein